MRSKIEANEYKDYILGFIFYKYLSDQFVRFVTRQGDTRSWIVVHRTVKTYLKS
ncbi:type I restriction-modification system subunit M N-terminal domain-containing protein [Escherichia coli]|nr:type I restriction-modification system subunit M N-terminal domain-containing protein [Escherichia fergusonii]MDI0613973.1 type I restriction-modification system subunit M N-terminal domain-containing protein [Escherichia coli]WGC03923.1 type I restriction-modification system subunit M N-terminal domain-containing protein [Escherichia coli]WGC13018.1 type I restriction-modification system subunit M N-terminal domain-containing protein [Escherichia coli]WGC17519.1 type I restriction-modificat